MHLKKVTARWAVMLGFFLNCQANAAESLEDNEWLLADTPLNCFLSQAITPVDPKIQRSALVLGDLEFVASRDPNDTEDTYVRVTTTVPEVVQATTASIRIPHTLAMKLRERRPGGAALRYVEFNSNPQSARALAKAMRSAGTVSVDLLVSPLSIVRGSVSTRGFAASYAKFLACKSSVVEAE